MPKSNLRPLDVLVKDIKAELKEIDKLHREYDRLNEEVAKLENATMARERVIGAALVEAKAQQPHRGFRAWVEKNFPGRSFRQYSRWMRMVKVEKKTGRLFSNLEESERQTKKPRRPKALKRKEPAQAPDVVEAPPSAPEEASGNAGDPDSSADARRQLYADLDDAPPAPEPKEDEAPLAQAVTPTGPVGTLSLVGHSDEAIAEAMAAHMNAKRIARIASLACDLIQKRRFQKAEAA
jgi:hypothetical protein